MHLIGFINSADDAPEPEGAHGVFSCSTCGNEHVEIDFSEFNLLSWPECMFCEMEKIKGYTV